MGIGLILIISEVAEGEGNMVVAKDVSLMRDCMGIEGCDVKKFDADDGNTRDDVKFSRSAPLLLICDENLIDPEKMGADDESIKIVWLEDVDEEEDSTGGDGVLVADDGDNNEGAARSEEDTIDEDGDGDGNGDGSNNDEVDDDDDDDGGGDAANDDDDNNKVVAVVVVDSDDEYKDRR